jgi:hypothetical protein
LSRYPDLLHQQILDLFDSHSAHHAGDRRGGWVEVRCGKEVLERGARGQVVTQRRSVEAGEPLDHFVEFVLRASLLLHFLR